MKSAWKKPLSAPSVVGVEAQAPFRARQQRQAPALLGRGCLEHLHAYTE
jgi:hypothetical protein